MNKKMRELYTKIENKRTLSKNLNQLEKEI